MGALFKIAILVAVVAGGVYYKLNEVKPLPELRDDDWWGPGTPKAEDTSIRPFKIDIPATVIDDLKARLKNHRPLTPPLEGIQQQYGINTRLVEKIAKSWINYNWTERQTYLNKYPQFKTRIQGLDIHFIHVKPKNVPQGTKVLPLILLHGWPGSVVEFYETIPLLTTPRKGYNFVFEVVVPSLPGYGFSQGASKPGLSARHVAPIFNNLMKRLGFDKYYVQGGDWGSTISLNMALFYPNNIKGMHSNMCLSVATKTNLRWLIGSIYPELFVTPEKKHKLYPLGSFINNQFLEFGYMHLQATKPDTVGVALTDSPIGLASYILEKFTTWTNPEWKNLEDGGLEKKFTVTKLLDNVMIYYVTNSITTSMRLYSETLNSKINALTDSYPVSVPTGCLNFAHELAYQPESWLRDTYQNLVHYKEHDDGGHFAAFELPSVLADDVFETFNVIENPSPPPKI